MQANQADTGKAKTIPASFFSESAVATFIITPAGKVVFWNKACEKLTGILASEVVNNTHYWQAFYEESRPCLVDIIINGSYDDLPKLYSSYGKSNLSAEGIRAEGWYKNLGGKRRYIIFDAAPIFNDNGELVAAIETLQDITEIKDQEAEKNCHFEDIENLLATSGELQGFVPICASCKGIRDEDGRWQPVEEYFIGKLGLVFSHGICPPCARKLYPEFYAQITE